MLFTPEEAQKMQCHNGKPCAASKCMCWRWDTGCARETDGCDEPRGTRCHECPKLVFEKGYCGLAGEVYA